MLMQLGPGMRCLSDLIPSVFSVMELFCSANWDLVGSADCGGRGLSGKSGVATEKFSGVVILMRDISP